MAGNGQRAPHPALRGLVTDYVGYRHTGLAPGVHHGLPSLDLTVVIAFDDPVDVSWQHDPGSRGRHWALVSGLHTGPALVHHDGAQHGIQLGLTPRGARVLLGMPAAALASTLITWEIPGPYEALAGATSWAARFAVLDAMLLERAAAASAPSSGTVERPEVAQAWRRIVSTAGTVRVGELAEEVGWSRRRLTDRFTAEIGFGPKQAARIERFQRARVRLQLGHRVVEVAADGGYADQAHLTRDFRDLGGCTPTQWQREMVPFVQDDPGGP